MENFVKKKRIVEKRTVGSKILTIILVIVALCGLTGSAYSYLNGVEVLNPMFIGAIALWALSSIAVLLAEISLEWK